MLTSAQHLALLSNMGKLGSNYIVVWPNGSWCIPEELEQFGHLSDDCTRFFYSPDLYDDNDLEMAAYLLANGCSAAYVHWRIVCSGA